MFVVSGFEVDFGFDDVVERFLVAFGFGASFFAVEYVIGARSYLSDELARGADAFEWFNFSH
jgi:hypothetical protein